MRGVAFVLVAFMAGCGGGATQVGPASAPGGGGSDGGVTPPMPGGGGGGGGGGGIGGGGSGGIGGGGSGGVGGGGSGGVGGGGSGGIGGGGTPSCDLTGPTAVWPHPVQIVSRLMGDDTNLYFLYGTGAVQAITLFTVSKSGVVAPSRSGLGWPRDVAVDGTTIYVASRGHGDNSPVDGGVTYIDKQTGTSRFVSANNATCHAAFLATMTVFAGEVYWSQEDGTGTSTCTTPPGPPSIDRVPAGVAPIRLIDESSANGARALLADDSHLFWADDAGVWRIARLGGNGERLSNATDASLLATDGNSLFYVAPDGVHAITAPLVSSLVYAGSVADIADDGQHLYVSGSAGLVRMNGDGSDAHTLAPGSTGRISVDDRYVYFIANDDTIAKACK
jgi:hypothetical protein